MEDMIAEGDRVAVRLTRMHEGKPAANMMVCYRIVGGRIADDWVCYNQIEG